MGKKKKTGISVFGWLFILGSLYYLIGNSNYDFYRFMFQQYPESVIQMRYAVTISLRILGASAGIGLLFRDEKFRKLAIGLCVFTILTIYWKHPYSVFYNIAVRYEYGVMETAGNYPLKYSLNPMLSMIFFYTADIVFAVWCILYLINPQVIQEFRRKTRHVAEGKKKSY